LARKLVAPPFRRAPAILLVRRLCTDRRDAQQREQVFPGLVERSLGVAEHGVDGFGRGHLGALRLNGRNIAHADASGQIAERAAA
jgi:hypothetical protein